MPSSPMPSSTGGGNEYVGWGDELHRRWKAVEALRFDDPRAEKGIQRFTSYLRGLADHIESKLMEPKP